MNGGIIAKCNHRHAREEVHIMYFVSQYCVVEVYEIYIFAVPVVAKNTIVVFDVFHNDHALMHNIR